MLGWGEMPAKAYSIMYHDVVPPRAFATSGISGSDSDLYKIERTEFCSHLNAIGQMGTASVGTCLQTWPNCPPVFLTFDDGGASAFWIAEELERRGWRGHFFVVSDWIGRDGFVTADEIRELDRRGHVIGSHSRSHPTRISALSEAEIVREWRDSVAALSALIGHTVTVASVPGGFYSTRVGDAAMATGIEWLFTSEPTTSVTPHRQGFRLGRYFIQQGMGPEVASSFAGGGSALPRRKQALLWTAKSVAKSLGGEFYIRLRKQLIQKQVS